MKNNIYTVTYKCRKCGKEKEVYVNDKGKVDNQQWVMYMHEKIMFPIVDGCDCVSKNETTVKDIISFKEPD